MIFDRTIATRRWWQFSLRTMFAAAVMLTLMSMAITDGRDVALACFVHVGESIHRPLTTRCVQELEATGWLNTAGLALEVVFAVIGLASVVVTSELFYRCRLKDGRTVDSKSSVNRPETVRP